MTIFAREFPIERLSASAKSSPPPKASRSEYYRLTGKPLGVTGEVAEYVAACTLRLKLAPPRTAGHDATRLKRERVECLQIEGRALQPGKSQKLGKFNVKAPCDTAILVLVDIATLDAREIWEAPFGAIP